jgi:hypothetical protein
MEYVLRNGYGPVVRQFRKPDDKVLRQYNHQIIKGILHRYHRKPTYTDVIIPKDFCHPNEHKMAAIRYFHDRLRKYQLSPENRKKVTHYNRFWKTTAMMIQPSETPQIKGQLTYETKLIRNNG